MELDRPAEALAEINQGLPLAARLLALDPDSLNAQRMLPTLRGVEAQILGGLARYDEAITVAEDEQRIRAARAALSPDDAEPARDAAILLYPLADLHAKNGKAAAACAAAQRAARAWAAIKNRWGMSELDQREILKLAQATAGSCPG